MRTLALVFLVLAASCRFEFSRALSAGDVRGRAVTLGTAAPVPVERARITLPGTRHDARSDARGRFTLREVPGGTWSLELGVDAPEPLVARVRGVVVEGGRGLDLGDVVLARRGTLQGTVTQDGTGVDGLRVLTDWPDTTTTRADGTYALDLAPSTYSVRVLDGDGRSAGPFDVTIRAGQVSTLDVTWPGTRLLQPGRVRGEALQLGNPDRAGIGIRLESASADFDIGPTDTDGMYDTTSAIPGGAYTLVARAPDGVQLRRFPVLVDGDTDVPLLVLDLAAALDDDDHDGVPDATDVCPLDFDPGQEDLDTDRIGDACDPDVDGDGIPNEQDGPVRVEVAPDDVRVTALDTVTFTAVVVHDSDQRVTWRVLETAGGTIDADGRYTAPATAGTYTIGCASVKHPAIEGTAVVHVLPIPEITAFGASKNPIIPLESARLSFAWSAGDGATARLDPGAIDVSDGLPRDVSPTVTTTYTLTVTSALGRTAERTLTLVFAPGTWRPTLGNPVAVRSGHVATPLLDGRVLITGGTGLASAELYDTTTGTFTATANDMRIVRAGHGAMQLSDGRVLVCGGANCDLFDPATNTFSAGPTLAVPRSASGWAPLSGDRFLAVGGFVSSAVGGTSLELVDPGAGTSTLLSATLPLETGSLRAVTLPDGRVVATGGVHRGTPVAQTVVVDPHFLTVTRVGDLHLARPDFAMLLMPDGRPVVVGGLASFYVPTTEFFDVESLTWTSRATNTGRRLPAIAHTPDGKLFITGGFATGGARTETFWIDPDSDVQTQHFPLVEGRWNHTLTPLPDGRLLLVGGGPATAAIFDPDAVM